MRIDPRALHYGESNDPAKMAYSRMALIRRGPSAKPANSNSHAGHITQAADQHTHICGSSWFERGSAHLATQPLRMRNSERKDAMWLVPRVLWKGACEVCLHAWSALHEAGLSSVERREDGADEMSQGA